jgi:hypothetical protein
MKSLFIICSLVVCMYANLTKDYTIITTYTIEGVDGKEQLEFFGTTDAYRSHLSSIVQGLFLGSKVALEVAANSFGQAGAEMMRGGIIGFAGGLIIGMVGEYKEKQKYPLEYLYITGIFDENDNLISKKITLFTTKDKKKYKDESIVKEIIEKETL